MKENKLVVTIEASLEKVFYYTTNPKFTHLWLDCVEKEESTEFPPQVGTIYRNHGGDNIWNEYEVSSFEENKVFELKRKDSDYMVRYTYVEKEDATEMTYFEWGSELSEPFPQEYMEDLKAFIEGIEE